MEVWYIVKNFQDNGYFDVSTGSFRGYSFATHYASYTDAEERISLLPTGVYQIEKIFIQP